MMIKPLVHSLFASLVMASIGCGNGLSSLTGTVRVDGQPAPEGVSLEFSPTAAGGAPSYGSRTRKVVMKRLSLSVKRAFSQESIAFD